MGSIGRIVKLFDLKIFSGRYEDALKSIGISYSYACFLNAHMLYEHKTNPAFKGVLEGASFVFPDGMPIVFSLKLLKGTSQQRIAGNDIIFDLINLAKTQRLKIFLIGSTKDVLSNISIKLSEMSIIHKTYSPPFSPIQEFDFDGQTKMINEFQPDMVLVGLGCPKQELWMYAMKDSIKAPMYGLGGAFLLFAGIDKRAPLWIRSIGMEWGYRLLCEPKRLFKRYFVTNTYFCYLFFKELIKKNH